MSISIALNNRAALVEIIANEFVGKKKSIATIALEHTINVKDLYNLLSLHSVEIPTRTKERPNFADKAVVQQIVDEQHFKAGKSLREIEREMGIGKTVFQQWCKRHGIRVRSRDAATRKSIKELRASGRWVGEDHWAHGLTKETHPLYAWASKRMTEDNPIKLAQTLTGKCQGIRKRQLDVPPKGEEEFFNIMRFANIVPDRQMILEPYICDFAFTDAKVIVEIDGKGHHDRIDGDIKRDIFFAKHGWTTLRRSYTNINATTWGEFIEVLKQLIPNIKLVSPNPIESEGRRCKHWMIVCQANTATRIKFNQANDPAFVRLIHGSVDSSKSALMG